MTSKMDIEAVKKELPNYAVFRDTGLSNKYLLI